ncbi:uncharacterized protein LOC121818052 isoform X2 [Ovis aries]|uniref:uncharacterized protein LOC121818052 isoform X2 n=1 Tax=Ovis aries TaxID=9940 RepID=UPI001C2E15D3|nr:uncharacterized protein LOC121818052 isoform X2 [Ovis aries]
MRQGFQELRQALLKAPALALPNPSMSFQLFVDEKQGVEKGVLTQQWGPWKRPVAYLSKRLDPVAAGWPPCLRITAATALLVHDADKLTYGQRLLVYTPHATEGILKQPPEKDGPLHDCGEILADVAAIRKDLKDVPLKDSELVWLTDGSSFVKDGQRRAGAAIVDDSGRVIWAEALPPGTSAQKAELMALIQALKRAEGKRITIYTDSQYAFGTVHIQGPIYKELGFLTAEGKEVKNLPKIRRLLAAIHWPRAVSIVPVPGHQKGEDIKARGNHATDVAAREAAIRDCEAHILTVGLPPLGMGTLPPTPEYSSSDLNWIQENTNCPVSGDGWYRDQNDNLLLPADLSRHLCTHLHQTTHLEEKKTLALLQTARLRFPQQKATIQDIVRACKVCQMMRLGKGQDTGVRYQGERPGQHWEIDFTEVDGIGPWVHCNHVRRATSEEQETAQREWKVAPHLSNPLKLKLIRQ